MGLGLTVHCDGVGLPRSVGVDVLRGGEVRGVAVGEDDDQFVENQDDATACNEDVSCPGG